MSQYQSRLVAVTSLPFPEGFQVLNPEQVIIDFPGKGTLDIGSLCFLRRGTEGKSRRRNEGRPVDLASLSAERTGQVQAIIQYVADRYTKTGVAPVTAHFETSLGIVNFMDWADANGHHMACSNSDTARSAFVAYVDSLWERLRLGEIKSGTASRLWKCALQFLSNFLGVDHLQRGLNLPQKSMRDVQPTVPPVESSQAKALSLSYSLFHGLADLVLKPLSYPHKVALPKYLGWKNSWMWVFPLNEWFRTPSEIDACMSRKDLASAYDFAEGRVRSLSEVLNKHSLKCNAQQSIRRACANLSSANMNPRHSLRLASGVQALQAFTILFIAHTGMNLAQVMELEWDGEYEIGTVRQKFRVIKWRAHGKLQSFEIQSTFLPDFKRFLELRNYLLGDRQCKWLFFSLGVKGKGQPEQMKYYSPRQMYQRLMRIDPNLPVITPRQWRSANVDWMLRRDVPLSVAADVMQNSEETLRAAYTAGSPETHKVEMTAFLDRVSSVVLDESQQVEDTREGPVGLCSGYGNPRADGGAGPVSPDCRNPEGCFFCDKYKAHADEHDVRKLISCRFCIHKTAPLAASVEHFDGLFGPVLARIESILAEIGRRSTDSGLVARIANSVEEDGELDAYWAAKLELLLHLELVSV